MLIVLLLKFLEHWSGFTFISSFSFFFLLNQFLVLINLIDVWVLKLCYRLLYDGRFPVFNYLLGVIELYLWGNFYIHEGLAFRCEEGPCLLSRKVLHLELRGAGFEAYPSNDLRHLDQQDWHQYCSQSWQPHSAKCQTGWHSFSSGSH